MYLAIAGGSDFPHEAERPSILTAESVTIHNKISRMQVINLEKRITEAVTKNEVND
jgi:hypothetical protein